MKVEIYDTLDEGRDVLLVRGAVDGQDVEARGWLSAMTHHFDEPRTPEASPREMTAPERRAYCERLLAAAAAPAPDRPRALALCTLDARPEPEPAPAAE